MNNFVDAAIFIPAGIILNIIIFMVLKKVLSRSMKIGKAKKSDKNEVEKLWQIGKTINVGVWIVGIALYLFLNIGAWNSTPTEMPTTVEDQVKTQVFEKPEVIEEKNEKALEIPDIEREIEVKIEQDKSKDDYEAFLQKSLQGVDPNE